MVKFLDEKREKKRIIALAITGPFFVIILPLLMSIGGYFLDIALFLPKIFFFPLNLIIGIPLAINGFFWGIWSNVDLYKKGKGSPVPTKDTESIFLVESGPFKYSRNPMTFGTYFIYVGLGVMFNLISMVLILATIMLVFLIVYQKKIEEKGLEERFGDSYKEYKSKTSYLIPWFPKK